MSTSRSTLLQAWPALMTTRDHLILSSGVVLGPVTLLIAISSISPSLCSNQSRLGASASFFFREWTTWFSSLADRTITLDFCDLSRAPWKFPFQQVALAWNHISRPPATRHHCPDRPFLARVSSGLRLRSLLVSFCCPILLILGNEPTCLSL